MGRKWKITGGKQKAHREGGWKGKEQDETLGEGRWGKGEKGKQKVQGE